MTTKFTPAHLRQRSDRPNMSDTTSAMLRQAAEDANDAERFRKISAAFDDMKTSTSERFLDCLGIDGDVCASLGALIDTARKEPK